MSIIYHKNRKTAWNGIIAYHDNGKTAWNETIAYHSNGETAWNGIIAYHENGKSAGSEGIEIQLGPEIKMHVGKEGFKLFVLGNLIVAKS